MYFYLINKIKPFISNKKGQGMVEYALIIAGVAILLIGAIATMKGGIEGVFNDIASKLANPTTTTTP